MGRCPNPTGVRARPRRTRRMKDAETRQLPAVAGSMRSAPGADQAVRQRTAKARHAVGEMNSFSWLPARLFLPGSSLCQPCFGRKHVCHRTQIPSPSWVQGQWPSLTPRIICWDRYQKAARTALRSCRRCHTPSASPPRRHRQNSCRPPQ